MKLIRAVRITLALSLGLTLAILWLLFCPRLTQSKAQTNELHVCLSGCPYTSIQAAVDSASEGNIIKVATGVYTDVSIRPRRDVTAAGIVTQVVYISKTVTIQGGYTTTNWTMPYPITQPTTLNAQGQGRVMYITGNISPTIEGLHITGGDASGLGGSDWQESAGNGIYVIGSRITLKRNVIFSNTSSAYVYGAGLYLQSSMAELYKNEILSNTAGNGGGIVVYSSTAMLTENWIHNNTWCGAVIASSVVTLTNNVIDNNAAGYGGGGALVRESKATLIGNTIRQNTALQNSGGVAVVRSEASLERNLVAHNSANEGGGIGIFDSNVTLANNTIAENAGTAGSGLYFQGSQTQLLQNTLVHNTGGSGIDANPTISNVASFTNTIIVSHTVGLVMGWRHTTVLNGILWFGNGANTGGDGTIAVTHEITGDPAFAPDGYHLTSGSAAIDQGVDAGVTTDIDGEPRPRGLAPDLGADEYWPLTRFVSTTGADVGDCSNSAAPCRTVQYAVDMADKGNAVKVATGVYTSVNVRPRNDITTTGVVTQVVYVSKTVTIQGGYAVTNWTTPYPITQPTTLDAQGQGRVMYITGNISPTVAGFDIMGGKAEGLGGQSNSSGTIGDAGGGVYIITATARLSHNRVFSNAAEFGNGLYLRTPSSILSNNKIFENWTGAGFFFTRLGGGLFLYQAGVTLQGNDIISNAAVYNGGGLFAESSHVTFMGNHIAGNEIYADGYGGGVLVFESVASFDGDVIESNTSVDGGGGLALLFSNMTMTNTVIRDNRVNNNGSGLSVLESDAIVFHSTIAGNTGGAGSGVYVGGNVTMTNMIVVSQTVGIIATAGSAAMLDGVLWFGNGANTGGAGTITVTHEITGDSAFAPDGYHLTLDSAAIDRGVDAGVTTDIDGDPRPHGLAPDLGADEFSASTVVLDAGWNLVALPLQPLAPYQAQSLLDSINSQANNCSDLYRWLNGGWDVHINGLPFNNFDVMLGQGYFIRCTSAGNWSLPGYTLSAGVAISLQPGWNLVALPYPPSGYTAQSWLEGITSQGGACSEIDRWQNGGWNSFINGLPFNNFGIEPNRGYFIRCSRPSSFTPQ